VTGEEGWGAEATADDQGSWQMVLHAPASVESLPHFNYTLTFTSTSLGLADAPPAPPAALTIRDVVWGDVWLCSGQSNMAFTLAMQASGSGPLAANATAEIAAASTHSSIRLFNTGIHHGVRGTPAAADFAPGNIDLQWSRPSAAILGTGATVMGNHGFSSVCWMFGREIARVTGRPIGLVATSNGGSAIESWLSPETLYGSDSGTNVSEGVCPGRPAGINYDSKPVGAGKTYDINGSEDLASGVVITDGDLCVQSASLPTSNFLGQISPLTRLTIKAAIWYQAESNSVTGQNETYQCRFKAMIDDWRDRWHRGTANSTNPDFAVGFVQIGPNCGPDHRVFATRIGQANGGVALWPGTFMASAIDLPNTEASGSPAGGVHLMDKPTVAHRLALGARATVYGEVDLVHRGPRLLSVAPETNSKMRYVLTFETGTTFLSDGLELRGGDTVSGFEIFDNCGFGGVWVPAFIVANTSALNDQLTVETFSLVRAPSTLRYAHRDTPCPPHACLVYNTAGLPLTPFEAPITRTGIQRAAKTDDGTQQSPSWRVPGRGQHPTAPDCFRDAPNSTCHSDPRQFQDILHACHSSVFAASDKWRYNFATNIHLINGTYLMSWSAGPVAATENWLSLVIATSSNGLNWSTPQLLVGNLTSGPTGRVYKERWAYGFENEPFIQVGDRLYAMGSFGNQTAAPPKSPLGAEAQVIVRQVTVAGNNWDSLQLGQTFWLSQSIPLGFEQYQRQAVGLSSMDSQTQLDMANFFGSVLDTGLIPSGCRPGATTDACWVGDGERSLFVVPATGEGAGRYKAVALLRNVDSLFSSSCELPLTTPQEAVGSDDAMMTGHCRPGSNDWHLALPGPGPVQSHSATLPSARPIKCNWTVAAPTNIPDAPARTCASVLPSGAVFLLSNPAPASKSRLPLTIAIAKDGQNFDQAWAIRRDAPSGRYYRKRNDRESLSGSLRCVLMLLSALLFSLTLLLRRRLWWCGQDHEQRPERSYVPIGRIFRWIYDGGIQSEQGRNRGDAVSTVRYRRRY
jgi:sialate O-acetylesterase